MDTIKLTIKITDSVENTSVLPQTLSNHSNISLSYLHKYKIIHDKATWHGPLEEATDVEASENDLLIPPSMAESLQFKDGDKVELTLSTFEPLVNIQVKEASSKKSKDVPKLCEGIVLTPKMNISWEGNIYRILSCDPLQGHFTSDTTLEDLTKDKGTVSKKITPLKSSVKRKNAKGFDKIVGLDQTILEIRKKILFPLENPEKASRYMGAPPQGAILSGPYGNGKTSIARAIAEEADMHFINIPIALASNVIIGPDIINEAYKKAAANEKATIIFIDELDSIAPKNREGSAIISTLQECMDGFSQNNHVFTLAATNHVGNIADGLLRSGRFDIQLNIPLPDTDSRKALFSFFLEDLEKSPEINVRQLAQKTASYTSSDIQSVVNSAGSDALDRHATSGKPTIITSQDLISNIDSFVTTGAKILQVESPKVSFDDMFGADTFINTLTPHLDLISGKKPAKYSNVKGAKILFKGPPGTGKTHAAKAIANYLNINFVYRSATSFNNKWVGETEAGIRKLFSDARTYAPIVLFLDEVDAIAKERGTNDPHNAKALNELLVQLEGFSGNDGIYFIGATNRPDSLDPAFLSRMNYEFELPLPNRLQRSQILQGLLKDLPIQNLDYEKLALDMEGFSHRDLNGLVGAMRMKLDLGEFHTITNSSIESLISKGSTLTQEVV